MPNLKERWYVSAMKVDTTPHPRLTAGREGYIIGDERVNGFADRDDLDDRDRALLARWASRFTPESLTIEQEELLRASDKTIDERTIEILESHAANEEELECAFAEGCFDQLTIEQRKLAADPSKHPDLTEHTYPLDVDEVVTLTGILEEELAKWIDEGLVPTHPIRSQNYFNSAAIIRVFVLQNNRQ